MSIRINIENTTGSLDEIDKEGNLTDYERKSQLFPFYKQWKQISRGIVEEEDQNKDYANCKTKEFDKKYIVNKNSGKKRVEVDKKFDCDFAPNEEPVEIKPKEVERFQKLAAIQKKYDNAQQVRIAKPMFDRFMQWLDKQ